jgi:hypothetical protein
MVQNFRAVIWELWLRVRGSSDKMIETTELFVYFTASTVLEESGSSLLSLFTDCFLGESVRKQ